MKRKWVLDVKLERTIAGVVSHTTVRFPVWTAQGCTHAMIVQVQKGDIANYYIPRDYPGWEIVSIIEKSVSKTTQGAS